MTFYTIHPREIEGVLLKKQALIIDVREREEYQKEHYRNALNCPYEELDCWMHRFPRKRALLLYCDYGSTSLLAARRLSKEGYEVYTVIGGMHAITRANCTGNID